MSHVTDERSDRPLGRELHDWIESSIDDLPDGSELPSPIRSDVLSRLPGTPQRRRWWPFKWFPFGLGATRSTDADGPPPEGRNKSMFVATRIAAAVAILALVGSFAYAVSPVREQASTPAAQDTAIDAADFGGFIGVMACAEGELGETASTPWGSIVTGETYPRCAIEASDPRISGNQFSVHDYHKYDDQPHWGVRNVGAVITNEDGAWVGTGMWGYQHPKKTTMSYAGQFRGTGAYEGLTALVIFSQDQWGLMMDIEGVIFPGDLPDAPPLPLDAAQAAD